MSRPEYIQHLTPIRSEYLVKVAQRAGDLVREGEPLADAIDRAFGLTLAPEDGSVDLMTLASDAEVNHVHALLSVSDHPTLTHPMIDHAIRYGTASMLAQLARACADHGAAKLAADLRAMAADRSTWTVDAYDRLHRADSGYAAAARSGAMIDHLDVLDTGKVHGPQAPHFRTLAALDAQIHSWFRIFTSDGTIDDLRAARGIFAGLSTLVTVDDAVLAERIAAAAILRAMGEA